MSNASVKARSFVDSVKGSISRFTETVLHKFVHTGIGAQQQLEDHEKIIASGVLRKLRRRKGHPSWHLVYAVVHETFLYYYEDETSDYPLGAIALQGYNQITRLEDNGAVRTAFAILPDTLDHSRVYTFATLSLAERQSWMENIRKAMLKANISAETSQKSQTLPTQAALQRKKRLPSPPAKDFDEIEQPIYEVIKEGEVAATPKASHVAVADPSESDSGDSDDSSNYLPPTTVTNHATVDSKGPSGLGPISPPPSRRGKRTPPEGSVGRPAADETKPRSKPSLPPKPTASAHSTPASDDQSDTQQRSVKKVPGQQPQVSPALLQEIKSAQNAMSADKGSSPRVPSKKKIRLYWSGSTEEALSALQDSDECGTYLIRCSGQDESALVLVVRNAEGQSRKVKLVQLEPSGDGSRKWCLANDKAPSFVSLVELVKYHTDTPLWLGGKQIVLTKPLEHELMTVLPQGLM